MDRDLRFVRMNAVLEAAGGRFLEMERLIAADGAVAKPISADFLLKRVRELLGRIKINRV